MNTNSENFTPATNLEDLGGRVKAPGSVSDSTPEPSAPYGSPGGQKTPPAKTNDGPEPSTPYVK